MDALITALEQTRVVNYVVVSLLTAISYDILLNLSREIRSIWLSNRSLPKLLYISVRYYGFGCLMAITIVNTKINPSIIVCRAYFWWLSEVSITLLDFIVNAILVVRIHALYEGDFKFSAALTGLLFGDLQFNLWDSSRSALLCAEGVGAVPPGLSLPGCLLRSSSFTRTLAIVSWIPTILLTALLYGLTVYKFYRQNMEVNQMISLSQRNVSPVFSAFFRDGTIYFLLITVDEVINMIIEATVTGVFVSVSLPYGIFLYSFAGSRLILNLREAATDGRRANTVGGSWSGAMSFCTMPNFPESVMSERVEGEIDIVTVPAAVTSPHNRLGPLV
ncbi:hypothetical protein M422DRAFT_63707 [Sphaerobolus stellatus SS14]|nr:hypothetical protein M422DRAFT_63707 [Sphaerobolus stellatus SS14]